MDFFKFHLSPFPGVHVVFFDRVEMIRKEELQPRKSAAIDYIPTSCAEVNVDCALLRRQWRCKGPRRLHRKAPRHARM